jgi:ribonuclease E
MANKMIIDASHPEETRVVVLRGNRVEEFDFESANKKPLRGNIYLAKVTRVEPSLQAAFVDYGGNRHGFLAFSEIHPDYYQIPVADRQALLEEDAQAHGEDEPEEYRSDRRSRRHRRPKSHEAEYRAHRDERIVEPAEVEGAESPEETGPVGADARPFAEPDLFEGSAPDELTAEAASPLAEDTTSAPKAADATPLEPRDSELVVAESYVDEAAPGDLLLESHTTELREEAQVDLFSDDDGDDRAPVETTPRVETEEVDGETLDDDRGEVTTLNDGAEEIAPRARRNGAEDEGEPVEQIGGDAMEELPRRPPRMRRQYKIQEVIKRRQVLLVQVVKEERGNKGAALTTYLSLAGRYSVLMPNTARGGGISRKITNSVDRSRLKSIAQELEVPEGMGVILRTAGAMRTKAEVKRDFEYLLRMWETVRETTLSSTAPTLVYEEGSLIKRAIRDLYNKDIDEIVVAGEEGYREAKEFMRLLMPSHAKNVQPYRDPQPVFARSGVEAQLDAMFSNQVTLKSGGYIVINQTEALVAIDVNSGRSTREHNIEDTALRTNLEAADEVARQLRLRDLAGLIVVDFIDMEEGRNNRAVERRMKDALKNDRARIQVGRISHFGLLEMSRQRIRTGVLEGSTIICPHCTGAGVVRSTASIALHVLRVLEDALIKSATHDMVVKTRTEVALYILNQKRSHLRDLERRFGVTLIVAADDTLAGSTYHALERGELATGVKQADAESRALPSPTEEAAETEASVVEDDEDAELESRDEENAETGEDGAEAAQGERREDADGGRRRRRRRRRRGGPRESLEGGIAPEAPQPTDAGLAVMVEIGGDLTAPAPREQQEEAQGHREGRESGHRRGSGWRRPRHDRSWANPVEETAETETAPAEPAPPAAAAEDTLGHVAPVNEEPAIEEIAPVLAHQEPSFAAEEVDETASNGDGSSSTSAEIDQPAGPPRPKRSGWWQRARASIVGE